MKASGILITGALAVLAIAVTSCTNTKTQSTAAATPPAASADSSPPPPAVTPALAPGVPVSLGQYFNDQGIYPDDAQFSGGIDRDGYGCSSNFLASLKWNGMPLQIDPHIGGTNVITCAGQTIALTQSGHFSRVEILALAVNGGQDDQDFTVTYADGSTHTFTQSVSDWAQPDSNSGESVAITMNYRDQSDGTKDDNAFYIFGYSFALDSSKTPQSLKLPDNNNVKVFAMTLVP